MVVSGIGKEEVPLRFGLFAEWPVNRRWSLNSAASVSSRLARHLMFNYAKECTFCPVQKVYASGATTINLDIYPSLHLFAFKEADFYAFAGPSMVFNLAHNHPVDSISIDSKRHPGTTHVGEQIAYAIVPFNLSWVLGMSVDYWRLRLTARYQRSPYTRRISYYGNQENFFITGQYISITLGYKITQAKLK